MNHPGHPNATSGLGRHPTASLSPSTEPQSTPGAGQTGQAQDPATKTGGLAAHCRWFFCCHCCARASYSPEETELDDKKGPQNEPVTVPHATTPNEPAIGDSGDSIDPFSVLSVEFLGVDNGAAHHTNEYEGPGLVVRRGQPFDLRILLNRPFDLDKDVLSIQLTTGEYPQVNKGTEVLLHPSSSLPAREWGAYVKEVNHRHLILSLSSPPDCIVGRYKIDIGPETEVCGYRSSTTHVYVLFNPWCCDDAVYLEDEEEKKEYVLNETGLIYYGTQHQIGSRGWNFGQFEEGVLRACFDLLDRSGMPVTGRHNPVSVSRVVSAMVNCQDDRGVLEGNWSGDYILGTPPTAWNGSVAILRQYSKTGIPVRYGQCWVFSAVVTTVMRCLGIPCRSVTNFASAHDTDTSLTVDVYFDEDEKPIARLNGDSVWNFHVWNDCWMKRPDLPEGCGGWQAIDATPQETSAGSFQCGPASINAIKDGMVFLPYDTPFVFAEVNSDRIFWLRKTTGETERLNTERHAIGHNISTKAVGLNQRQDVTQLYKHSEGSQDERIAVELACKHGSRADFFTASNPSEVTVHVKTDERAVMGNDVIMSVVLQNLAESSRQVCLTLQVQVMYYTGVCSTMCKREKFKVNLDPKKEHTVDLQLNRSEYLDLLKEQCGLLCYVTGRVVETKQPIACHHSFRLCVPRLHISCTRSTEVGKEVEAVIEFTNPLPRTLQAVELRIEGPGLHSERLAKIGNVGPGEKLQWRETFKPVRPGLRKLIGSLSCTQLTQVHGEAEVEVIESTNGV
uniref:protein-glutamine gamma-glutamyltransferase K n=1 Tax=Myxine glutinosa TaxID=7769 RepID=UPI00358EFDF0